MRKAVTHEDWAPALRSESPELLWPAFPSRRAAELLALIQQLQETQWWSPELLRRRQLEQFARIARHAHVQSPFYRERLHALGAASDAPWDDARFSAIPLLTRQDLSQHASAIHSRSVPKSHGTVTTVQTSGSTGQPVAVRRTAVNLTFWSALNMRDHFWHRRDFKRTLAIIRARVAAHPSDEGFTSDWGEPANLLFETGRCHQLPLDTDVTAQVEWLRRHDPDYLLTYPTNLSALLDRFESSGTRLPNLTEVRTVGETLREGLRERCSQLLGARVVDGYSSQEVGAIALQCDQSLLYHLHSESLMVEVLDAEGRAVRPGETGRVVVTDLHNFATPLIRYELRDHAEVGAPCPCGRGLPTLSRILGRQRNMVVLPNGARYWPLVGYHRYREVAGVVQYQLIQHSLDEIEMRLVVAGSPLSGSQEERLASIVRESLRHPFRIRFTYFDRELPRTRTGKFEEFVCHVA